MMLDRLFCNYICQATLSWLGLGTGDCTRNSCALGAMLHPGSRSALPIEHLCPRCRAGLCDRNHDPFPHRGHVSMPSVSGWALRLIAVICDFLLVTGGFYALGVGLGSATIPGIAKIQSSGVSMPSVSGWALRQVLITCLRKVSARFLCPRCRAGLCHGCRGHRSLACGYGVRCAILSAGGSFGKMSRSRRAHWVAGLRLFLRQPRHPGRRYGRPVPHLPPVLPS
jgi:hypothetical protein